MQQLQHRYVGVSFGLWLRLIFVVIASIACTRFQQAKAEPSQESLPLVLSRTEASLSAGEVAAIHPNGRRLYLGERYNTDSQRLNLLVFTLDDKGSATGGPRRYRDSALKLPAEGRASVAAILPDEKNRKLYIAYALDGSGAGTENRFVSVYDLDTDGEPQGEARSYFSGNPNKSVLALALHPQRKLLYMVGWGGAAVYIYRLNDHGEPQGEPQAFPLGGQGKYQVTLDHEGRKLYLGTYPDVLEVIDLDASGFPTGKPRIFKAGDEKTYFRFEYSPGAIFFKKMTSSGERLAVWPLDSRGEPVGAPQVREEWPLSTLAVDAAQRRLWIAAEDVFKDAFTGKTIVEGVRPQAFAIGDNGALTQVKSTFPSRFRDKGVVLTANGGRVAMVTEKMPRGILGNRIKDYRARVTLLDVSAATGATPVKVPFKVAVFNKGNAVKMGELAKGETTPWVNLDGLLKDNQGQLVTTFSTPLPTSRLQLRVEIAQGDPTAGGKILRSLSEEVLGNTLLVLLPGYGFDPPGQRVEAIELLSEHAGKYLDAARAVALRPDERPQLFPISCSQILGGQGSIEQLRRQAEAVASLGFNTANAYWWGAIPASTVDSILDEFGLKRRTSAVYKPPSYFAFDSETMNEPALLKWAAQFPENVAKTNAGTPADVAIHSLSDEPGWYYPTQLNVVRDNPKYLEAFRVFLRAQGLKPLDVGQNDWTGVFPIGASEGAKEGASLGTRRLFYWTMRFFPESSSRAHRMATDAVRKVYGHPLEVTVNWNNWLSNWYGPSPNMKIANNPVIGPDSAYGSMDWFTAGRYSAHTLWSEDWFGDQTAQTWSLYADMLRSASMLGESNFGGYVIGASTGAFPAGAKYKIMSLLGHGGKVLDMFTFGPELLFPGNCWSEGFNRYAPIAEALRLVGKSERLLYPGRPERGKVAILVPSASRLWEQQQRMTFYQLELWGLHHALVHSGYGVDFVDDIDLAGKDWSKRGYTTLYLTAPNIAATAQAEIVAWVRGGGTLVATPGAGVADEYNSPSTVLDAVLGVKSRNAVRDAAPQLTAKQPETDQLVAKDPRFTAEAVSIRGPVVALQAASAATLAGLKSGGAAITGNQFGKGRGIAYAFFPGWQYWLSPDRSNHMQLPQDWSAAACQLAVAPVRVAETPRSVVVSQEGVEAVKMQSDKGIAVTLLNWSGVPVSELTVTLPGTGKFRKASSASGATVKSAFGAGGLVVKLPLKDVDVLMIE